MQYCCKYHTATPKCTATPRVEIDKYKAISHVKNGNGLSTASVQGRQHWRLYFRTPGLKIPRNILLDSRPRWVGRRVWCSCTGLYVPGSPASGGSRYPGLGGPCHCPACSSQSGG